jgi:hypothetical protein
MSLEATNVIEASLFVDSGCQRLNPQVESKDALLLVGLLYYLVNE